MKFVEYIKNNKVVCGVSIALGLSLFFNWATFITISSDITEIENLETNYNELKSEYNNLKLEKEELEKENHSLEKKVEQAKPWFEMKEEERIAEQKRLEQEKAEREEQERLQKEKEEQERLAKEKAEQEEKERKEKQGYNTGITYSQLARTPDEYEGEKVKFNGKVLQVMESSYITIIRLGVNGSYDNVLYLTVIGDKTEQRILEDDYITIYGTSQGIHTYTSTMGASISIPKVSVDKIDM